MKVNEAYKVLEIPESSSKEDAKKAFRKLAAKYHPDVNKDTGAEDQFKKINEAWRVVETGQPSTREEQQSTINSWGNWAGDVSFNFEDIFNNFGATTRPQRKKIFAQDISLSQTLSFKESITGCMKDIDYDHNVKCATCNGVGEKAANNGCDACHGIGRVKNQHGNTIIEKPCAKCRGKVSYVACDACKNNGFVSVKTKITVKVPPGAVEGSVLNLGARGNYIGSMFGTDQNTRLSLLIHVTPQEGLSIRNSDVICEVRVSLLEAFRGCTKTIPTIDGEKEIEIPKLIKNKEEISLPNLGVGRKGNQSVIVNVNYPNNIEPIIEILEKD